MVYTTYKSGDDWGMVYKIRLPTLEIYQVPPIKAVMAMLVKQSPHHRLLYLDEELTA